MINPLINAMGELKLRLPKIFVYFIFIWFRKIVNRGHYQDEIREALDEQVLKYASEQLKVTSGFHPDLERMRNFKLK
jgi:hypothetical protein|tara:strand:- start:780 stop:1010 length:231 start_codon:yes stop_codon:yes gene_type:complete